MAPAAIDMTPDTRSTQGGLSKKQRKQAKTEPPKLEAPKQAPAGPPTADVADGLEQEFDKFFSRLHEQQDEFESNLVSGLNAQKSLEQRHAELQAEQKKRDEELAAARAEIEKLKESLGKKDKEVAARDAEVVESKALAKKHEDENREIGKKVAELEGQVKLKDGLVNEANEKARKAAEEKDEALRAAEKRVQRILAYAQTKVGEVVDKNQELLKRLHGSL